MGKQSKQWYSLFLGAPKSLQMVTASHEIKRCFLLGRKAMTNLDSILKSRYITLFTKVCLVKAVVFPVVMYGCESWTLKKARHQRIDAFELWCWRRLLRVSWTARWSNQFILKEISPKYALEGLMLKLKLQYLNTWCKELTFWKRPWCWEKLKVGEEGDDRGWDGWMASLNQLTESMDMSLSKLEVGDGQGGLACYSPWGHKELDMTEQLNLTELKSLFWELTNSFY